MDCLAIWPVRSPHTHTEDAEEKGRRVVLGLPRIIQRVQHPPRRLLLCTEPQDAAIEAANPGRQRQDSREGMPSPSGQALGQWHGKGNHVPPLWSHYQRQGRDHWDQLGDPTATDDRREDASLQPDTVDGSTELDLVQGEIDDAERLLEEAHLEVQAAWSNVTAAACRVEEAMEEMAKITSLMEANLESAKP